MSQDLQNPRLVREFQGVSEISRFNGFLKISSRVVSFLKARNRRERRKNDEWRSRKERTSFFRGARASLFMVQRAQFWAVLDEVIRREHEDYEAQPDRRAYYGCHRGDAKSVMRDRVRACVLALVCRGWVGAGQAGKGGAITQVWIMSKRCNVFRGFQPKYCMLITLWYAGLSTREEIWKFHP